MEVKSSISRGAKLLKFLLVLLHKGRRFLPFLPALFPKPYRLGTRRTTGPARAFCGLQETSGTRILSEGMVGKGPGSSSECLNGSSTLIRGTTFGQVTESKPR